MKNAKLELKSMRKAYQELLTIFGDRVKEHEPLARYTTFKIGGPADYFFEARTQEEFVHVVQHARKHSIPLFVLGGGSNMLIGDKGIRGLVVKNATRNIVLRGMKGQMSKGESSGHVYVEADSGVIVNSLVRFTIEEGLGGLEMQLGLPGTVGGAIYMNSKWTHPQAYVGDCVYQVTIINSKGELSAEPQSYFNFGYDTSSIQKTRDVVVSVIFVLQQSSKEKLWEVANMSMTYRKETQPQGVFSSGCTFRNISHAEAISASSPNLTTSAGFLVDLAGLKGKTIGDAQISPVHANFIVNNGHATASDIVQLIDTARSEVKKKFGITLTEEIVRIGEF